MVWKEDLLGDICFTTSGGTPSRKNHEYYKNGTIPWVKSGELENNIIFHAEEYITQEGLDNSSAKIFPAGTLLIALYGATIGKLSFLGIDAATNQAVCGLFKNEKVSLKYLYYYLLYQRPNLIKLSVGGAQLNISQTILKKLPVPYPLAFSDQELIVARIEELFSQLDSGVDTLKQIKQQLAVYRQTVLKEAFTSSTWEEDYAENVTSTEDYSLAIGPFGSNLKVSDYTETGVRLVFVRDIRSNFKSEDKKYVSEGKANELFPHQVNQGDLLITKMGDPPGDCCIYPFDLPGIITSDCLKMKVSPEKLDVKFAMYYVLSPFGKEQIAAMTQGVAQKKISLGRFKKFRFSFPNIDKQRCIVQRIESYLSVCDSIEETVNTTLQQAEAMRQSILKKAFEGGLL